MHYRNDVVYSASDTCGLFCVMAGTEVMGSGCGAADVTIRVTYQERHFRYAALPADEML